MKPRFDTAIGLPDLLAQVGREFADLAAEVEQLQDTVSELLDGARASPRLLEQAQALDHVFQHMTQLGEIVARAADQSSAAWTVEADRILDGVSLSGLVSRLSGQAHEPPASGDMEMF